MPVFEVTLEKSLQFTVAAKSLQEVETVAQALTDYEINRNFYVDPYWDKVVLEIRGQVEKADCGIKDGKFCNFRDLDLEELEKIKLLTK